MPRVARQTCANVGHSSIDIATTLADFGRGSDELETPADLLEAVLRILPRPEAHERVPQIGFADVDSWHIDEGELAAQAHLVEELLDFLLREPLRCLGGKVWVRLGVSSLQDVDEGVDDGRPEFHPPGFGPRNGDLGSDFVYVRLRLGPPDLKRSRNN